MALLELNYYSKALKTNTVVNVILPERTKAEPGVGMIPAGTYKTMYLLHGLHGNQDDWLRKSCIERYAAKYDLAVVMPSVGNSWYADTCYGTEYFTFVTKELPEVCRGYFRGMSDQREDNIVAGLSMGGYGALKAALLCPETFGYCASLSGSLDITRKGREWDVPVWRGNFNFTMENPGELEGTPHDIFSQARKNHENGVAFPKLYMWCGTEDALIKVNREYHAMLNELGVEHGYEESEGDHSWPWWDLHIQDALRYLLGPGK